jgi:hypothetical protein
MHICFAGSPIHLICFKQFIIKHKIKNYKIYLFSSTNPFVNKQLDQTVKFLNLNYVNKILWCRLKIIQIFQRYKFLLNIYFLYKNINCIFLITDFRNTIHHQIRILFKRSKFILLDDGSQIPEFYPEYFKKNIFFPSKHFDNFFEKLKLFINYGSKLNFLINSKLEFFTIYGKELKLNVKYRNALEFLRDYIDPKYQYSKSSVYLVGSKFFEQNLLQLNEEINSIKKVKNYWLRKKKKLIYFSKRTTSLKKINLIRKIGIEVIISELPLELYFLKQSKIKIPRTICSFGSAVDKIFPMIFSGSKTYLITIKELTKYNFFFNYFKFYKNLMLKLKLKKNIIEL